MAPTWSRHVPGMTATFEAEGTYPLDQVDSVLKIAEPWIKTCWISLRMHANYQTDRHTKISELFGTSVQTSQECLQKISERYIIQNWRYPYIYQISVRK